MHEPQEVDAPTRQEVYKDLVQISGKVLKLQINILLDRFDRTDRMIRLGVATLAGMIAIIGFLYAQDVGFHVIGTAALLASILGVMVSIHFLIRIQTSLHRDVNLDLGPDPRDFTLLIENEEMKEKEYFPLLANRLPAHIEMNSDTVESISSRQGRAVMILITAVIFHLTGIAFILGGHIHG